MYRIEDKWRHYFGHIHAMQMLDIQHSILDSDLLNPLCNVRSLYLIVLTDAMRCALLEQS